MNKTRFIFTGSLKLFGIPIPCKWTVDVPVGTDAGSAVEVPVNLNEHVAQLVGTVEAYEIPAE